MTARRKTFVADRGLPSAANSDAVGTMRILALK